VQLSDDIVATASTDPALLDINLLTHGVAAVLSEDHLAGIGLCLRLVEAFQKQQKFDLCRPMLEFVIEPTIYDARSALHRLSGSAVAHM
jgi:hypothetical protein